jgi:hypothetical protein
VVDWSSVKSHFVSGDYSHWQVQWKIKVNFVAKVIKHYRPPELEFRSVYSLRSVKQVRSCASCYQGRSAAGMSDLDRVGL